MFGGSSPEISASTISLISCMVDEEKGDRIFGGCLSVVFPTKDMANYRATEKQIHILEKENKTR